jgi:hypothetical protein
MMGIGQPNGELLMDGLVYMNDMNDEGSDGEIVT